MKRTSILAILSVVAVMCVAGALAACSQTSGPSENDDPVGAYFEYHAEDGGTLAGEGKQFIGKGEEGTAVTAVADDGYLFEGWSDGVETPERKDKNDSYDGITGNTFIAMFSRNDTQNFAGGSGSGRHPYVIRTAEHLKNVASFPKANFILESDITLPAAAAGQSNFTPIGSAGASFCGEFNGNGHTISGLTINNAGAGYAALFGEVGNGGYIHGLTLDGVNIVGGQYVGGIAAYCYGKISDCTVSGSITATCAEGVDELFAGGIAGYIYPDQSSVLADLSADVNITVTETEAGCDIGGLFGQSKGGFILSDSTSAATISADWVNYAVGSVTAGGLVGSLDNATVTGCSSSGRVEGSCAGGLIGYGGSWDGEYDICISDSYSGADVWGVIAGGFAGRTNAAQLTIENSYSTGDVTAISGGAGFIESVSADSAGIVGCYSTGDVYCRRNIEWNNVYMDLIAGGFIGTLDNNARLTNCASTGSVTLVNDSDGYVGGLVGWSEGDCTLKNCFSESTVTIQAAKREGGGLWPGMSLMAGGLFGRMMGDGNVVNNCYYLGEIFLNGEENGATDLGIAFSTYIGGLAADAGSVEITNSYFYGTLGDNLYSDEETRYHGAVMGWAYKESHDNIYYSSLPTYETAHVHVDLMSRYWNGVHTDFENLASALNRGQAQPDRMWKQDEESGYPMLLWWNSRPQYGTAD